jgi:electron transport complex protein RnfD
MKARVPVLELQTSPHVKKKRTVEQIMRNVVYALLPICAFSFVEFGLSAVALIVTCVAGCVATEHLLCRISGKETSVTDYSAIITGLLLALTLPPGFPLWMALLGSIVAIGLGKTLFGGIGFNVFNPALVGRAFLQAAFPVAITTWTPSFTQGRFLEFIPTTLTPPFMTPPGIGDWLERVAADGFSGATPLALQKFSDITTSVGTLFVGLTAGSAGESSSLLILVCGGYLVARRMMDWRIPAAMLGAAALTSGVYWVVNPAEYPNPLFMLFSGGLMLGAVFMASDMVASPVTPLGVWIYGGLMGFITIIIRIEGGLPEGVMYAILLGNAASPIIDNLTQPRIFGARKKKPKAKAEA